MLCRLYVMLSLCYVVSMLSSPYVMLSLCNVVFMLCRLYVKLSLCCLHVGFMLCHLHVMLSLCYVVFMLCCLHVILSSCYAVFMLCCLHVIFMFHRLHVVAFRPYFQAVGRCLWRSHVANKWRSESVKEATCRTHQPCPRSGKTNLLHSYKSVYFIHKYTFCQKHTHSHIHAQLHISILRF